LGRYTVWTAVAVYRTTLIEVWQANSAGQYDTEKPGNFTEHP
jgi:protocatechuate 3,4-dioxygenase beta subunit